VALVSPKDQGTIIALLDLDEETMCTDATINAFAQAHEVMVRIAQS
jgi:hypothetical protein